jgi:hypothetical protein
MAEEMAKDRETPFIVTESDVRRVFEGVDG